MPRQNDLATQPGGEPLQCGPVAERCISARTFLTAKT